MFHFFDLFIINHKKIVKREIDIKELKLREIEAHNIDLKEKLMESQKLIESNNSSLFLIF